MALCVSYDIPLVENIKLNSFKLPNSDDLSQCDPLFKALLNLLESNKKSTVFAASEVIGKILQK